MEAESNRAYLVKQLSLVPLFKEPRQRKRPEAALHVRRGMQNLLLGPVLSLSLMAVGCRGISATIIPPYSPPDPFV